MSDVMQEIREMSTNNAIKYAKISRDITQSVNWPSKCVEINDIAQIKIQLVAINELIYDLEKKVKFLEGLILCNE